jgi:hypothetical protein
MGQQPKQWSAVTLDWRRLVSLTLICPLCGASNFETSPDASHCESNRASLVR